MAMDDGYVVRVLHLKKRSFVIICFVIYTTYEFLKKLLYTTTLTLACPDRVGPGRPRVGPGRAKSSGLALDPMRAGPDHHNSGPTLAL
jgi:hypothetical protein